MEAYGKLFYFDKDGFQAGFQGLESFKYSWLVVHGPWIMVSKEPMTKWDTIPSTKKSMNYYDFKDSELNPNYSFIRTDEIELGIV